MHWTVLILVLPLLLPPLSLSLPFIAIFSLCLSRSFSLILYRSLAKAYPSVQVAVDVLSQRLGTMVRTANAAGEGPTPTVSENVKGIGA